MDDRLERDVRRSADRRGPAAARRHPCAPRRHRPGVVLASSGAVGAAAGAHRPGAHGPDMAGVPARMRALPAITRPAVPRAPTSPSRGDARDPATRASKRAGTGGGMTSRSSGGTLFPLGTDSSSSGRYAVSSMMNIFSAIALGSVVGLAGCARPAEGDRPPAAAAAETAPAAAATAVETAPVGAEVEVVRARRQRRPRHSRGAGHRAVEARRRGDQPQRAACRDRARLGGGAAAAGSVAAGGHLPGVHAARGHQAQDAALVGGRFEHQPGRGSGRSDAHRRRGGRRYRGSASRERAFAARSPPSSGPAR